MSDKTNSNVIILIAVVLTALLGGLAGAFAGGLREIVMGGAIGAVVGRQIGKTAAVLGDSDKSEISDLTRDDTIAVSTTLAIAGMVLGFILIVLIVRVLGVAGISLQDYPTLGIAIQVVVLQGISFGAIAFGHIKLWDLDMDFIKVRLPTLWDIVWIIGGFVLLLG
ncbi:MAG: hypothetical protein SXQ77_07440, partial [Halobacteria archaeon]|nr:hypothetical protein [Halobacteria archaeon]